jgi:hypothetical protein
VLKTMATLPNYAKSGAPMQTGKTEDREIHKVRLEPDPFLLRTLPGEDVYFFSKRIDNSGVERQPNPRTRRSCWSAAAVMCVCGGILAAGVAAPRIANTLAGYKVEALKQEQQRLLDERKILQVEEAGLLSPARLDALAPIHHLVPPKSDQLFPLDPKAEPAMAALKVGQKVGQ